MPIRYDEATRAKAIRLVREHVGECESEWAAMVAISDRLEMRAQTLRKWVRQDEVDSLQAAGVTTESSRDLRELKRRNAELEQTIEILKAATTSFVRECDPRQR